MAAEEGWVGVEVVTAHLRVAKESIYRWIEKKGLPPIERAGFYDFGFPRWTVVRIKHQLPRPSTRQSHEQICADS